MTEYLNGFEPTKEDLMMIEINKLTNQVGGCFKRINMLEKELIDLVYQMRARIEFTDARMR